MDERDLTVQKKAHCKAGKRVLSAIMVLAMLCTMMCGTTVPVTASSSGMTLAQLQAKFPEGKYWNGGNADRYTSYACTCHNQGICIDDIDPCNCNHFQGGTQCNGFARKLAYDAYGSHLSTWQTTSSSSYVDALKPGDVVYNDSPHWFMVISVSSDSVTVGECNWGSRCVIEWSRTVKKSTIKGYDGLNIFIAPYALPGGSSSTSAPVVTEITASAKYAKVGDSVTFSFPAYNATKYELVITNTTTGERIQYTMLDSSSFTQIFWSEGLHLVQVNAYGTEIVGFDNFYFEVHSGNRPNTYVGGKNEDWCFTPQELTILHDAPMQERIVEAVLNYYKDGTLWCTGSIIDTGLYTTYFYPGAYEGNILLTYESGYSVYTKTRCWYVGEKPSGAVITASSTMPKVGDMVTFTLNATGGTEHCIYIGDGNEEIFKSLTSSCTYQFTKAGTYYVYGWTRNAYGENYPEAVTITVGEEPSGAVITASSTAPKVGDTVTFTLNATGGTEYCICIGNGDTEIFKDLTNSSTYQFTKAGTYYIYGWTRNAYGTTYPDTVTLIVEDNTVSVTGVSLNKTSATIDVGDILNLTATVSPSNATNTAVTWTSSNPSVATVTNGTVTALKAGTTTITATTVDGSKTATCVVTVNETPIVDADVTYTIGSASSKPGSTVEVALSVSSDVAVNGLLLDNLNYDKNALQFVEFASYGDLITSSLLGADGVNSTNGSISLGYKDAVVPNGQICVIKFQIKDTAEDGEYIIKIDGMASAGGQEISSNVNSGKITISQWVSGDFDSDEKLDMKDVVYFMNWVNFSWSGKYPMVYEGNKDFDKDGTVDMKDVVYFMNWVNFSWSGKYTINW